MEKFSPPKTEHAVFSMILAFVFFQSSSPVLVLTSFLFLCGIFIYTYCSIFLKENKSTEAAGKVQAGVVLVNILVQVLLIALVGGITWYFLYKKISLFAPLLK